MPWIIGLVILVALTLLGASITYATGAVAVIAYFLADQQEFLLAFPSRIFNQMDIFALMAMPMFILLGEIMNRGGITNALIDFAEALVGRLEGALGHVNILTSVFFAGISGAAMADAAALGNTLVPAMTRRGYSLDYAAAITAASSIIGPIVPPSIIMIFYGAVMGVDVAALFAGGIVPGALLALALFAANACAARVCKHPGGLDESSPAVTTSFMRAFPALALPVIIIVGIVLGWMTPTEAAAMAVLASIGVCYFYKSLNVSVLKESLIRTVAVTGTIFAMLAVSATLNYLGAITLFPQTVAELVSGMGLEGKQFIVLLYLIFLIFGMFSETQIALVLVAPLLIPIAVAQGANPVHLGVVCCLNLSMGLITPPLGGVLFIVSSTTGINYWRLVRATLPFIILELALLLFLYLTPEVTLFLPRLMGLL